MELLTTASAMQLFSQVVTLCFIMHKGAHACMKTHRHTLLLISHSSAHSGSNTTSHVKDTSRHKCRKFMI